ncbi:MAG TPA: hypothetical protein IAC04_05475 [Candidatus Coprenecus stercoravium]|uniref:BACON domain-containing protein n=1 Tax=Candidatus Coprenecus stercoravium TaxID=2840735 RepID=A0A9D2GRH6_9BACT|nr:hypothetical protein [Candidatus Coprenecus stercoravium]
MKKDWCTITPSSGESGVTAVEFSGGVHYGRYPRSEQVLFKASGDTGNAQVVVTVNQQAKEECIEIVGVSGQSVPAEGGNVQIQGLTNISELYFMLADTISIPENATSQGILALNAVVGYSIPSQTFLRMDDSSEVLATLVGTDTNWYKVSFPDDPGQDTGIQFGISFSVPVNPTAGQRNCCVVLRNADATLYGWTAVSQLPSAVAAISASPQSVTLTNLGAGKVVRVISNEDWEAE